MVAVPDEALTVQAKVSANLETHHQCFNARGGAGTANTFHRCGITTNNILYVSFRCQVATGDTGA